MDQILPIRRSLLPVSSGDPSVVLVGGNLDACLLFATPLEMASELFRALNRGTEF
jgi:hypothetical protein